jgi:hypothetical protein
MDVLDKLSQKSLLLNFTEIHPLSGALIHGVNRHADGYDKGYRCFTRLCEHTYNLTAKYNSQSENDPVTQYATLLKS